MLKRIAIALMICVTQLMLSQISSNDDAKEALNWLVENPQISSDSLFVEKSANALKWHLINNSTVQMRTDGMGEFIKNGTDFKYYREVMLIYMLSEIDSQVSGASFKESSFLAIQNVLKYYHNVLAESKEHTNEWLDEYSKLSPKELKRRLKKI